MKGNCAMVGRFAFKAEVNIAKVGNFAKDGNVPTKGQQIKSAGPVGNTWHQAPR
jgi:hypothetical protein